MLMAPSLLRILECNFSFSRFRTTGFIILLFTNWRKSFTSNMKENNANSYRWELRLQFGFYCLKIVRFYARLLFYMVIGKEASLLFYHLGKCVHSLYDVQVG